MTEQKPDLFALREGLPEGPWTIRPEYESDIVVPLPGHEEAVRIIATVPRFDREGQWERVARAIAAIPDMLEQIDRLSARELDLENRCRSYANFALDNNHLRALNTEMREALEQCADDFGPTGHCVCEQAKQMVLAILAKTESPE